MDRAEAASKTGGEVKTLRSKVVSKSDQVLASATDDGRMILIISPPNAKTSRFVCTEEAVTGGDFEESCTDWRDWEATWSKGVCHLNLELHPLFLRNDYAPWSVEQLTKTLTDRALASAHNDFDSFLSLLQRDITEEWSRAVEGYRRYLREVMPTGDNKALGQALKRVRAEEEILAGVPMADQRAACELLGLSTKNPSATMSRKEGHMISFRREGRPNYPLLQFNLEERSIYPAIQELVGLAKEANWSNFRVLNWLLRPHRDFDGPPVDALSSRSPELLAAFERAIEPVEHG